MRFERPLVVIAVSILFLMSPLVAWGLINPNYTPIHVVQQSETILIVKIKGKDIKDKVELEVSEALKGKSPGSLTIELNKAQNNEHTTTARALLIRYAAEPALFFSGKNQDEPAVFLHVHGTWLRLDAGANGALNLRAIDDQLRATWAGGTDMLIRCIRYILADSTAAVPVEPGTTWRGYKKIGTIPGKARDIMAVDLAGDGKLALFVASPKGDRLFRATKDGFEDVTEKVKLGSASRLAAWGDFTGTGRMDLASYDGKTLTVWAQAADGAMAAAKTEVEPALPADCVGLAVLSVGASKTPSLLVSPAAGAPLLLKTAGKYAFVASPLPGEAAPAAWGAAQPCLVADFTGNGRVDCIQPFEKDGRIYLAQPDGAFNPPKPCGVSSSLGGGKAVLGDFDGDGLPDVLVGGMEGVRIYQNLGGGAFDETLADSGEVSYKGQPRASWCGACDFNNDGRRDFFITYPDQPLLLYFNRGFRSFGQSPKLEESMGEIPNLNSGQQLGLFADFHNAGAEDFIVLLGNGELWCATNDLAAEDALGVKIRLSAKSPTAGPVNVSLWQEKRCLGGAIVQAGAAPAYFGVQDAGAFTLKWRFPDGKESTKAVTIDKQIGVVLEGAD